MSNIKFNLTNTVAAIRANGGLVSDTADALGVNRLTIRRWRKKYPAVDEAFIDAEESKLDLGESKLMEAVKNGESWAICFFLKCKGKRRGYVERQELSGPDGSAIEVRAWEKKLSEVQSVIATALAPYAEAKEAVISALKEIRNNGYDNSE